MDLIWHKKKKKKKLRILCISNILCRGPIPLIHDKDLIKKKNNVDLSLLPILG